MADFTLDTSGVVAHWHENRLGVKVGPTYWSDLDAFTQGYVGALFAERLRFGEQGWVAPLNEIRRFADLAPETLAAILKDCAERLSQRSRLGSEKDGADFYRARQRGTWPATFPPLTATLGDDGKVYLQAR